MTNLLVVEDHPIFAGVLLEALERGDDLHVVQMVGSAEEALLVMPGLNLDLIVVDVSLPKMSGIDLVGKLTQIYPGVLCLMISGHLSDLYLRRSLEAGARGYALKDSAKDIIEAIHQVMRGEIYICKELRIR
jgi:DNA-binding NarL/FixJ family response regulator